jgi:hypothetical protein
VDFKIEPANEEDLIDMTMFIVSLKRDNARKVHVETTNMQQLIENTDYVTESGKALLNFGRYNVHMVKRLQTFTDSTGDPQSRGFTRGYFKKRLNWTLRSASGDWSSSIQDTEWPLDKRLYIIIFNNNSSLDAETPTLSLVSLWSGFN